MKIIWEMENGEVEFESHEDFERYIKGEKPELELIKDKYYKASFPPSIQVA